MLQQLERSGRNPEKRQRRDAGRLLTRAAASDRRVSGLVLVPTRELAIQVAETFRDLGRYLPRPIRVLTVIGGVSLNPQMMALRGGADIVVGTPGRLLDLVDHNAIRLSGVSMLVLDEADRLLDEGFADELTRVLGLLPDDRQNLLFSATFPPAVRSLAELLLRNPVRVDVATVAETLPGHSTASIAVDPERRTQLLLHLGRAGASGVAVSFVCAATEVLFRLIEKRNRFRLERHRGRERDAAAGLAS
jgi:superfamily II DNA/RNA helicase